MPLEETQMLDGKGSRVRDQVVRASGFARDVFSVGPQIQSANVEADRYVSWFLASFHPARPSHDHLVEKTSHWLQYVIMLMHRQPALDQALLAISLTRYGKVYRELAVLGKGRQIYVRALNLLQQCLYDEGLAMLDETLATICVLVLYEVSSSS